jgi:hypothetical protein
MNPTGNPMPRLLVLLVVAFAAILRLACVNAEFWLDEIWSWELAHAAPSLPGVLTIRHDNSHALNSLWLRLWPATAPLIFLRLPALVAGLGAVVVAAVVARRRGVAASLFAALLIAGCSWVVFASAEARGYSLAVFFAFAALEALWRYLDRPSRSSLAAFWVLSALGFLSHLTFVHAYIGFVVWSMRRFARERPDSRGQVRAMLVLHGPVAAFFAAYYLLAVRGMEIGGGPETPTSDVLRRLISLGLGGPAGDWGWVVVAVAVGVLVMGLSLMGRSEPEAQARDSRTLACASGSERGNNGDVWTFFAAAVVASPALFLIRPQVLFERYFLIPFVFFLLLVAFVMGDLWRRRALRPVVLALLVGYLAGNAWQVKAFAGSGRGEFGEALAWIAEQDDGDPLLIAGDHDFRVRLCVEFYARRLSLARVRYVESDRWKEATWLLVHAPDGERLPMEFETRTIFPIRPAKDFRSRGRMSWGWSVFRVSMLPRE